MSRTPPIAIGSGPVGRSMMTSIAFITGLAALVRAAGTSEIAVEVSSTPVFVHMLAASTIGLSMIPMLRVAFQALRE